MDTLHSVLRAIRKDRPQKNHLVVFREFLSHLERVGHPGGLQNVKALRKAKRKPKRGKRA